MYSKLLILVFIKFIITTNVLSFFLYGAAYNDIQASMLNDTVFSDTIPALGDDTLNSGIDSLNIDSTSQAPAPGERAIDSKVEYASDDSILFDLEDQKIYLYGNAIVTYEDIELKAAYIEFNMNTEEVFAQGMPDTTGAIQGKPIFTQGNETFDANELTYNFGTKKGYIEGIITEQEGGYLHSEETKRMNTGHIHIRNGKYTTCDLEHPHFYVGLTRAIVKPDDKIVSGPAYIVIADVPIPIGLPFGFFPNSDRRSAGILIPSYGEEVNRGFYLRDLGYYFPLNEYMDLKVLGEIYSKGTWGTRIQSVYRKRYKYSGNFNFRYYENISGDRGFEGYSKSIDYSVLWSHRQDAKANPTQTFSANVNFSSRKFDQEQSRSLNNYMTNTKSSSISYSKRWPNTPFNFTAGVNHTQSSQAKTVSMNIPNMAFNMNTIYPLRGRGKPGQKKWYEDIKVSYNSKLDNRFNTADSLFIDNFNFKNFDNAFNHSIPVSIPLKLFKTFTLSPSIGYKGWAFTKYTEMKWDDDAFAGLSNGDSTFGDFTDTIIYDISYVHKFNYVPSLNLSFNKNLYGMFQSTRETSKVMAVRHVISPSASINFTPGKKGEIPDYYRTVYNPDRTDSLFYSIYKDEIVQPPSVTRKTSNSGSVSLSLRNNLEMKLRNPEDTAENVKKVKIIENLDFSTSYNMFADSLNWSPIRFNGGTRLLDQKINIRFNGTIDPYALDSRGSDNPRKVNRFEYNKTGRIGRLTNAGISIGLSFRSQAGKGKDENDEETVQTDNVRREIEQTGYSSEDLDYEYADFSVPWSFRADYSWTYSKPYLESRIIQTLRFSGDVNLTDNWKISMQSGYDFERKEITQTVINIHRDLHCWEMSLRLVPFGMRKSWNFQINVKSSVLRDLKYEMKRDWRDNL